MSSTDGKFFLRIWPEPEIGLINQAAVILIGTHDFAAFGTPPKKGGSTIRQVDHAEWKREKDILTFHVTANAFLYHMVRRMVQVQLDIGSGRKEPEYISKALNGEFDGVIQGIAPPQGLFLEQIRYAE